jgi:hypothetical protein
MVLMIPLLIGAIVEYHSITAFFLVLFLFLGIISVILMPGYLIGRRTERRRKHAVKNYKRHERSLFAAFYDTLAQSVRVTPAGTIVVLLLVNEGQKVKNSVQCSMFNVQRNKCLTKI